MIAALVWVSCPRNTQAAAAGGATEPARDAPKAPEPTSRLGNRRLPAVQPPPALPMLSDPPADSELFRARIFEEPLVPSGASTTDDNRALGTALKDYLAATAREEVVALEDFLARHPASPWRVAVLTNMSIVARRSGYFSKTLRFAEEAWSAGKDSEDPRTRALADRALAEMAELWARLGRVDELEGLLKDVEHRDFVGSVAERMGQVRQSVWLMQNKPEVSFRCGPLALENMLIAVNGRSDTRVERTPSTKAGTSLLQMKTLAQTAGLRVKMARRHTLDAPILTPSMVHWKTGHFAALVSQASDRYLLKDPTFGDEMWVSRKAIDEEADGYFLILDQPLPSGWTDVADETGGTIWGKGGPPGQNPQNQKCEDPTNAGNNCAAGTCPPMATYTFQDVLASLKITDAPVGYDPPFGPSARFTLTYNQREAFQPTIFTYSNVGPMWTFGSISYVADDPTNPAQTVTVYRSGGGQESYAGYNPGTGTYAAHYQTRALLVRTSSSPITFERRLADGSIEVFAQADGNMAFPRKVFLTEVRDPQGNKLLYTYDSELRIVGMSDALGQVTTYSYDLPADPLKITRVTDPFGRSASLQYDPKGRLQRITDPIGITSVFTYGAGTFITSLTTPYGTTTFATGQLGADRWIEATDPLGGKERMYAAAGHSPLHPFSVLEAIPTSFAPYNIHLDSGFTLYWDKRAMALAPGDPTRALQRHWAWAQGTSLTTPVLRTEKKPLESRVWYAYAGQPPGSFIVGSDSRPITVARVLDDGTSQMSTFEYNARGKMIKAVDPRGRETRYTYGTGTTPDQTPATGMGIDLLRTEQKRGAAYETVVSLTYDNRHLPLTATDMAGQVTTYSYNTRGQLKTVITPPRAGITENRSTVYGYDGNGYLERISRPMRDAVTTFTYDAYGRQRSVTDSEGYVLTYDYDLLDRLVRTTYPDGTQEETVFNRLDAERQRDRLGRWSHTVHDALRRPVSMRDPAGRVTTQQWCTCGSLDSLADPNGNATTWTRDLQARVTKEVRVDGTAREFTYEATTSRLKKVKDAKSQEKLYAYFPDDRLQGITYQGAPFPTPALAYSYSDPSTGELDAHARLRMIIQGATTSTYTYHPITTSPQPGAGRLASVNGQQSNDTIAYTYDELGRVVTRTLNGITTTSGYDALGRLTTLTDPISPVPFTYTYVSTTDRVQSVTYPNGQVSTYAYHPNSGDHRLQEIHHKRPGGALLAKFNYTYGPVGTINTWYQQNDPDFSTFQLFEYDGADQLTVAVINGALPSPQLPLQRLAYAYDPAGNRTTEQIDGVGTQAIYNTLNRLVTKQPGGGLLFKGSLDEPGTVTVQASPATMGPDNKFSGRATVPPGVSTVEVRAKDANQNERTNLYQVPDQAGATQSFTYDPNGNLWTQGTRTYEWDAENRLLRALNGGTEIARFVYDALGRRQEKTGGGVTRTYVYDDNAILEERVTPGSTRRYVHGPGIDRPLAVVENGQVSYFVADHLGSIRQVTNTAGNPTLTRNYDPWGNMGAGGVSTGGYAFTGREWDPETALYYYRARYYDPKIGRFLSEDPIGIEGGDHNLYAYVGNDPVNFVDPWGLIRHNARPPRTVPLTGAPAAMLSCLERCLNTGCRSKGRNPLNLLVTGGAETTGHSRNSHHYRGEAVDIAGSNPVPHDEMMGCAQMCGWGAGHFESFRNRSRNHWHFQLFPGNGVPALPNPRLRNPAQGPGPWMMPNPQNTNWPFR
jgi:RHS repeat-associated protein